jgi:UDP-N-acetylglucosamine 4-epimerase
MVFNCACHERIDLNQLVANINSILGKNIKPRYADARPGDVKHSFADVDRIKKFLHYTPKVGFSEGLGRAVEWYSKADY